MRPSNFNNLLKILRREAPDRHTLFELFLNGPLYEVLSGEKTPQTGRAIDYARFLVKAYRAGGYDYCTLHASPFRFESGKKTQQKTISLNENAVITDRESFDKQNWNDPNAYDYTYLDDLADDLPENFKVMVMGPSGVLENVIRMTGYDNLCYMIYEDEQLVYDLFEKVGTGLLDYYKQSVSRRSVGVMMSNDDWGFNTQTMLSPEQMRKYVFPWHKKLVEVGHAAGLPVILHSCGNLNEVMDDIIDDMKYDGKHSYEDNIIPADRAWDRWHDRIAILGGVDINLITSGTQEEIKVRCRQLLNHCVTGYALGTGNSVPTYVSNENFFAMTSCCLTEN